MAAPKLKLRYDTAANWTAQNPILLAGEMGIENDVYPYKYKIGDGTTPWNSLGYMAPSAYLLNIIAATNNTGGGTASLSSNVSFSNTNNVSFYTSAGNAVVASFSQTNDTSKAGIGFTSAGSNIGLSGTLNTNGLSLSATVAAQTNQTVGVYGSSQTTGSASSGTYDARSLSIIGAGIISVGNNSTSAGGTTTGIVISATQSNQAFSASGGSSTFQTLSLNNANGFTFSNVGGAIQGSYTVPTVTNSSWTVSDAATSATVGRLAFTQANGLTLSLSTSNNGNHTVFGSYTVPTVTNSSFSVQDSATTINPVARIAFSTGNNITLSLSTGASSATVGVAHNLAGTSTGFTGGASISGSFTHNSSGLAVSLSHPAWITTADLSQNSSKYVQNWKLTGNTAGTTSSAQGTDLWFSGGNSITVSGSSNSIVFSVGNYLTTARASTDAIGLNTAKTNVTWTVNSSGLSLDAGGYAGTGFTSGGTNISMSGTLNTAGLSLSLSVAPPGAAAENNWHNLLGANTAGNTTASGSTIGLSGINLTLSGTNNSQIVISAAAQTNQTIGLYATGNTTQNSSTTLDARTLGTWNGLGAMSVGYSNGSIQLSAPATSSLSGTGQVSISVNGSTISIGVPNPYVSSFQNVPLYGNSSLMTWNGASVSHADAFDVPSQLSFAFMRIPVLFTTNSTTIATIASNTASAQGGLFSTVNAVVYSLGTGANSKSLQYVTSGSTGYSFTQKISVTSSTRASYSLGYTGWAETALTSLSTQYSVSNTNYSFTTNAFTDFTSAKMLDLPFSGSLSAGPYWMVIGMSTSSSTAGNANLTNLTNCNVRYSAHYGMSQMDVPFGIMGSSNATSGGLMGAGSFSTAGGGTTNSIPISAISSMASLAMPFFQLLRSA